MSFGADITVNSFTVNSATQITANITIGGSAAAGLRDFSVTTPGGTATRTNGFTVLTMPTISSVSPTQAVQGQTLSVTITGTNLIGVTAVGFGSGITVNSFTVNSDTQITASIAISRFGHGRRQGCLGDQGRSLGDPDRRFHGQSGTAGDRIGDTQSGIQGQTENVTITGDPLHRRHLSGLRPGHHHQQLCGDSLCRIIRGAGWHRYPAMRPIHSIPPTMTPARNPSCWPVKSGSRERSRS